MPYGLLARRYTLTLLLLSVRPQISLYYPALLYFNQVFGFVNQNLCVFPFGPAEMDPPENHLTTCRIHLPGRDLTQRFPAICNCFVSVCLFTLWPL